MVGVMRRSDERDHVDAKLAVNLRDCLMQEITPEML